MSEASLDFLKLLAHDLRWQLLIALSQSDYRVQELVERLQRPMNLVSYHLKQLRSFALVKERRSSADGRDVYYSLDFVRLGSLYAEAGVALHPGLVHIYGPGAARQEEEQTVRVLFLCTHNSARSQMAEGLLRHLGAPRVEVVSAGTQPSVVHPLAVQVLRERQINIGGQRSKHVDEFAGEHFDYIITVCDQAREECPVFGDNPCAIHWSFADPSEVVGSDLEQLKAFEEVARDLTMRIRYLLLALDQDLNRAGEKDNS
jgi:ArsR family transcriptional regulator, arsenate/arsenite/antimonite-responsive transcriptional repressor / arsenate reductase (thioredoxin)